MVPDHWSNDAMVSMDCCGLGENEMKEGANLNWIDPDILNFG